MDGLCAAGEDLAHFSVFLVGPGEADFEALGFAEPAVGFGFCDAGDEVAAGLDERCPGGPGLAAGAGSVGSCVHGCRACRRSGRSHRPGHCGVRSGR